jgi:hypothetical protein
LSEYFVKGKLDKQLEFNLKEFFDLAGHDQAERLNAALIFELERHELSQTMVTSDPKVYSSRGTTFL